MTPHDYAERLKTMAASFRSGLPSLPHDGAGATVRLMASEIIEALDAGAAALLRQNQGADAAGENELARLKAAFAAHCIQCPQCHETILTKLQNELLTANEIGGLVVDKHSIGLYGKFIVTRTDGKSAPGQKHDGCDYFVLDITHDPFAIPALRAYADACRSEYPLLAADLDRKVGTASRAGSGRTLPVCVHGFYGGCVVCSRVGDPSAPDAASHVGASETGADWDALSEEDHNAALLPVDPSASVTTWALPNSEICICAAIRIGELVVRGHRHGDCFESAGRMPRLTASAIRAAEQGFVTSRNRFVDRGTGWCLQRDAGLASADHNGYRGEQLFSEDLY